MLSYLSIVVVSHLLGRANIFSMPPKHYPPMLAVDTFVVGYRKGNRWVTFENEDGKKISRSASISFFRSRMDLNSLLKRASLDDGNPQVAIRLDGT